MSPACSVQREDGLHRASQWKIDNHRYAVWPRKFCATAVHVRASPAQRGCRRRGGAGGVVHGGCLLSRSDTDALTVRACLLCRWRTPPPRTTLPPADHVNHHAAHRWDRAIGPTKRVRLPAARLVRPHASSGAAPTGDCRRPICGMAFTGRNNCIAWHRAHQRCPSRIRRAVCRRQRRQAVHSHMARCGRVIVWCPPPQTVTRRGLPWAGRPPSVSGRSRVQLPPLRSGHTGVRGRPPGPRAGGSASTVDIACGSGAVRRHSGWPLVSRVMGCPPSLAWYTLRPALATVPCADPRPAAP